MTTQNKAVTCYLPRDVEDFITGYCTQYGITRKDKEGNTLPSLGTGIIELLKLLAYNPELVGSPLPDTVPSTISEGAIEKKIEDILEKKLSPLPDNVPSIELVELQARLETLEQLLRLQQSASIATHVPDLTSIDGSVEPANTSPLPTGEPDRPATAIEDSKKKIMATVGGSESLDTSPVPPDEPVRPALATEPEAIASSAKKGLTDSELARHLGIGKANITRWKAKGTPTPKYRNWELRGRLWYKKD